MVKDKSLQVLIGLLSLLLHCCLILILALLPANDTPPNQVPVEVVYKKSTDQSGTIIQIDNPLTTKEKLDSLKEKVEFLTNRALRVKKQYQARRYDKKTVNRPNAKKTRGKFKTFSHASKYKVSPFAQQMPSLQSMNSNPIPNVEFANMTALNANQQTYYAFFSRANSKAIPAWHREISNFASKAPSTYLKKLGRKDLETVIEVLLSPKGLLEDILILESSGNPYADSFAVNSFKKSAPFFNPPKDLVQSDGLVHLFYSMNIRFRPRLFVRKNIR